MHRFYLPPDQCCEKSLGLDGREAHHALHVLRVRTGDRLVILDGAGRELLCEVKAVEQEQLRLAVVQENPVPPLPCEITLLQAIPKGKIMEGIIQKATELGAQRIVPLLSDRVAAQLDDESAVARGEKWRQTAIEAIKQCGSAWLPRVENPVTPREYLARNEAF